MKLAEIQNGLSYAGNTRKRYFQERACAKRRSDISYGQNNQLATCRLALKLAARKLAVATSDEFVKAKII